ncbi:insecticidal delta-endotoxin Cry8Ea1 family protein [Bacillus thuringiensis]|uniref:Crystaline entomocidal protoxin n=1 Tax=Bacillus thuringiensis TaxID=1428 RepID=A0A9X6THG4_BACTU|nr:insecticidal delta-endotoxin Cry8Ea1 family protein [Bacillus thuringiensis]PEA86378.1 hypothetical protein CON71_30365 [Bacillus thuringiensis]
MNRKKDCNCNDGIQTVASNMSDRYPYANDPSAVLQNMDYKDWLVMGQERGENPESLLETKDGVNAAVAMVGTLMWTFGNPAFTGPLGGVICAFGLLIPILWPDTQEPQKQKVWEDLINHGDEFFDEKIGKAEKARAKTFIAGMKVVLENYEEALKKWKENKNAHHAATVQMEFNDAGDYFDKGLGDLQLEGYQQILLPCYAQAALLHLNLLSQGVQYANEWGKYNPGPTSEYWLEMLKRKDKKNPGRIQKYVDYCTDTYRAGLNKLKNAKGINWPIYNQYRTDMTLTVLDLVAFFPNYDVDRYPKGTRSELTREIYTPLSNPYMESKINIDEHENLLTRKPHLFTVLRRNTFYTEKRPSGYQSLAGIRNFSKYIHDNNVLEGDIHGIEQSTYMDWEMNWINSPIDEILVQRELKWDPATPSVRDVPDGIRRIHVKPVKPVSTEESEFITIYRTGGKDYPEEKVDHIKITKPESACQTNTQPCMPNISYSHILSYISMGRREKSSVNYPRFMYSFAWTHHSVDRHNTIAEDTITQIPAVKASGENPDFSVVKGPGHTGGDLVELSGKSEKGLVIKCSVPKAKNYRIRLRYAANKDTRVTVQVSGDNSHGLIPAKKTYDDNNYKGFSSFDHLDTNATVSCLNKRAVITIKNDLADTSILIDKIEFIPLD